MLFNSIEFMLFLPIVFGIHWAFNKDSGKQNLTLLIASYIFYASWDIRFLFLIIFSSLVDYTIGTRLGAQESERKRLYLLYVSLLCNLGLLGIFKYYNFFIDSFVAAFTIFGVPILGSFTLNLILPVGISFYTFQTLSYTIDVYRKKIDPIYNPIVFFTFVSFFPQLVAGPIERASNLLPQLQNSRRFNYTQAVEGMRQILWGAVKKVIIADNCAVIVNDVFANYETYSASSLALGALLFAVQIYGDFSGYSDMAIGIAKLFGIELMENFAFPYFSRDIAEFWRRWHISLSAWFRDYVYIPLGGSKQGKRKTIINVMVVFLVSGLWHGANWTFVAWGALHSLYMLPLVYFGSNRANLNTVAPNRHLPSLRELAQITTTFFFVVIGWIVFRSASIAASASYIRRLFSTDLFSYPDVLPSYLGSVLDVFPFLTIGLVCIFFAAEWIQRHQKFGLDFSTQRINVIQRWVIYIGLVWGLLFLNGAQQEFIYFQF